MSSENTVAYFDIITSRFHCRLRIYSTTNNSNSFLPTYPPLTICRVGLLGMGFTHPHPHRPFANPPFALRTGQLISSHLHPPNILPRLIFLWEHDEDGRDASLQKLVMLNSSFVLGPSQAHPILSCESSCTPNIPGRTIPFISCQFSCLKEHSSFSLSVPRFQ